MTGPVEAVKAQLDPNCLARRLSKDGCRLLLRNLSGEWIAIDLDSRFAPGDIEATRCDYLFLAEDGASPARVVPIELKRGGFNAANVAAQLQAGADTLAKLLPEDGEVRFRALVASGRFPKPQRRPFMRQRVRFRGVSHPLVHTACGSQILPVLNP